MNEDEVNGQPVCLIPECGRKRYGRGLCRGCYQSAVACVRKGKVTWEYLVEAGMSQPISNVGRPQGKFMTLLKRKLASKGGENETIPR